MLASSSTSMTAGILTGMADVTSQFGSAIVLVVGLALGWFVVRFIIRTIKNARG